MWSVIKFPLHWVRLTQKNLRNFTEYKKNDLHSITEYKKSLHKITGYKKNLSKITEYEQKLHMFTCYKQVYVCLLNITKG